MDEILLQGMKRFQQRRRKTAGRSQSCPGRDIRHAGYLQVPFLDVDELKRLSNDRMFDVIDRGRFLQAGILEKESVAESTVDIYIDIFVDRGRDEKSRVL